MNTGATLIYRDGSSEPIKDLAGVRVEFDAASIVPRQQLVCHHPDGSLFEVERQQVQRILDHATGSDLSRPPRGLGAFQGVIA